MVKIFSILVAFLENMNFIGFAIFFNEYIGYFDLNWNFNLVEKQTKKNRLRRKVLDSECKVGC